MTYAEIRALVRESAPSEVAGLSDAAVREQVALAVACGNLGALHALNTMLLLDIRAALSPKPVAGMVTKDEPGAGRGRSRQRG